MCGIAGSINFKFEEEKILKSMGHRGPDEQAGFSQENVQLFHLRLSILDISGGKQPMHYWGRYTIVFNGEIYNHLEVRTALGLNCQTNSDTETILHAWQKIGASMLDYFDGMFALAIYDSEAQTVFLARDRAGKKPLYIYKRHKVIAFASELNALKSILPLEINENNFEGFLRLGAFYRSQTPYQDIQELPNGHYATINCQTSEIAVNRWWSIYDQYNKVERMEEMEAKEKIKGMIETAIVRRLDSSDLEVGCFLSGGIDSGIITAMASKFRNNLKTFTISFDGVFDESKLAEKVALHCGTKHTTIPINFNTLQTDIESILCLYGEPFFDSSSIPSYYVSKAARKHITVVLNGDGADELFGGYRRFVPFAHYNFFNAPPYMRSTAAILSKVLPAGNNKKSVYNYVYRLIFLSSLPNPALFIAAGPDIFEGFLHKFYGLSSENRNQFEKALMEPLHRTSQSLQQIMSLDFEVNLFSDLLVKMDIASMANSLEGRSPMLCKELLEFVPGLSGKLKINGSTTKYLLRKIAHDLLPAEISVQPKRGFEVPLKKWVNDDLKTIINDYINAPMPFFTRFISKNDVQAIVNRKWNISEEKRAKMLWSLFCMEVWYKKCYLN